MQIVVSALSRFTSPTGICRHAANLALCLRERNEVERVTVLMGEWQRKYFEECLGVFEGTKLRVAPVDINNSSLSRNGWFMAELPKEALELKGDILHLSFPVPMLHRTSRYSTVVSLHDLYPYDQPEVFGFPNVYFNRLFLRSCLKRVDAVACVSWATLKRLGKIFPRESAKARMIPNVVDIGSTSMSRPERWAEAPFVLVVAQHRANKNVEVAVRGFARMRARGIVARDCRLVIVGSEGPSTASIKSEITRLGLETEVMLLSALPEPELQWLYANCQLFLVSSSVEGFCLPVAEALGREARLVSSDIPSVREIAGGNCEYFELESSPESLADAAQRALARDRHERISLDRFSAARVGEAYVRLYESLLGANSGVPETAVA